MDLLKRFVSPAFFAVVFLLSFPAHAELSLDKKLTQKEILADLTQLTKLLKSIHPNLYAHRSPKQMARLHKSIRSKVPKAGGTLLDAFIPIQQTLAAVCDGHTAAAYENFVVPQNLFKSGFFAQSILVRGTDAYLDDGIAPKKIVRIGDKTGSQIADFFRSMTHLDGCTDKQTLTSNFQSFPASLALGRWLDIGNNTDIQVANRFSDDAPPSTSRAVNGNIYSLINPRTWSASLSPTKVLANNGFELFRWQSSGEGMVRSFVNKEKGIFYISVDHFLGGQLQMKETNRIVREIIASKPNHVILDLTSNPGGAIEVSSHLASYFLKTSHRPASFIRMKNIRLPNAKIFEWTDQDRKRGFLAARKFFKRVPLRRGFRKARWAQRSFGNPSYNGPMTILLSPKSRSASIVTSWILQQKRKAKVVGVSTAQFTKTSCWAAPGTYKLKNSGIKVAIPYACFDRTRIRNNNGGKLKIDVPVEFKATQNLIGNIVQKGIEHALPN